MNFRKVLLRVIQVIIIRDKIKNKQSHKQLKQANYITLKIWIEGRRKLVTELRTLQRRMFYRNPKMTRMAWLGFTSHILGRVMGRVEYEMTKAEVVGKKEYNNTKKDLEIENQKLSRFYSLIFLSFFW